MSALATLADSNIDPRAAYEQLKSVEQIIESIDTADLLVEVVDRAKLAQQWLKVKNAAAEVVLQAARVQLVAIRRIGQLGDVAIALLPESTTERRYAAALANLTDARFQGELDAIKNPIKASTFIQNIAATESYAHWLNKGYDIGEGKPANEHELWERAAEAEREERNAKPMSAKAKAREAENDAKAERRARLSNDRRLELMGSLLDQLYKDGDPFSVSDATDQMLNLLNEHQLIYPEDHPLGGDPRNSGHPELQYEGSTSWVREGVSAAIRHALMESAASDDTGHESIYSPTLKAEVHPPKFVTYMDQHAGWVRIPWSKAGLAQLQEMAALRRRQAEALASKAAILTELVTILERAHERRPDEFRCENLLRNEKRTGRYAA